MSPLLTLSAAAKILGVHPRTLRTWSDREYLPYLQTPGGHRRFRKTDLQNFVQNIEHGGTKNQGVMRAARTAVKRAIERPQSKSSYRLPPALQKLKESQRGEMKIIGRKLVGLVMRYVQEGTAHILEGGKKEGQAYGHLISKAHLSVAESIATFHFFRDPIMEVALASAQQDDNNYLSQSQVYKRLHRFFSEVELAIITTLETSK
jgi:excisionase family DNA binding protein